jgi:hypothetical protein
MPLIYLMLLVFLWYWFQTSDKLPEPKQIDYSELKCVRVIVSDVRIDEQQLIAKREADLFNMNHAVTDTAHQV